MKRKLSGTSSEASILDDNDERGGVYDQLQPSSALALEQNIGSDEAGGFLLAPHLAQSLGMSPGEMIFRSMFYDTPQASHVSCLVAQLLNEQEVLLSLQLGEGTSFAVQSGGGVDTFALIEYNAATIQALMDSVEAPSFAVVPEVVIEESDAMYWQAPGAPEAVMVEDVGTVFGQGVPEQSASASDEGFVLVPDLALRLGMCPGQTLRRSMFYGTPQSDIVLEMVNQLSAIREDLLRNQELERAVADQEVIGVDCEGTSALIATNEELVQALMDSIKEPAIVIMTESEELEGLEARISASNEQEALKRLARLDSIELDSTEQAMRKMLKSLAMARSRATPIIKEVKDGTRVVVSDPPVLAERKVEDDASSLVMKEVVKALEKVRTVEELIKSEKTKKARLVQERRLERNAEKQEGRKITKRTRGEKGIEAEAEAEAEKALELLKEQEERKVLEIVRQEIDAAKERLREEGGKLRVEREKLRVEREKLIEKKKLEKIQKEDEKRKAKEKAKKEAEEAKILAKQQRHANKMRESEAKMKAILEERASIERAEKERPARIKALLEEKAEKIRDAAEERATEIDISRLRMELERVRQLERAAGLDGSRGMEGRALTITREELELELDGVREQEQNLRLELDGVRARAQALDTEIRSSRVILGATEMEMDIKRKKFRRLNKDRSVARVRELELEIEILRVRARARVLGMDLERLRAREQDQD
ncbi:hypothetical protein [Candidatus Ichthyocystis sparus]|uniref:hypothetical protein n=2 Tax=Candidatus Ichthyocystis sparus TaxID=1561004 RepID=UPI000B829B53|nr:hypothetical protein [Candidatus Ichthyocystis sparus]